MNVTPAGSAGRARPPRRRAGRGGRPRALADPPAPGRARPARRRARSSRRAARRRRPAGAPAPRAGRSSARASTSMFVRRLVKGVRSSCEASATKRRWLRAESSSAASIVLKLPARRPSSSVPSSAMRRERSRVAVTSSVASVSRRTGRERGARDDEAERRREPDAAERDEDQDRAQPVEGGVHLGERPRDLEDVAVLDGGGQDAHVVSGDLGVAVVGAGPRRGRLARPLVDREREVVARRPDRALGAVDLDVAARGRPAPARESAGRTGRRPCGRRRSGCGR